jgi:hypothetical protein
MKQTYGDLPVKIRPLYLRPHQINAERLLSLMHFEENGQLPLYAYSILTELRSMGVDNFSFEGFKERVAGLGLNPTQSKMLQQRFHILESFMLQNDSDWSLTSYFKPGQLTLVDLLVSSHI